MGMLMSGTLGMGTMGCGAVGFGRVETPASAGGEYIQFSSGTSQMPQWPYFP